MTDANASHPFDTQVRVPLSAEQLQWIARKANARNVSERAFVRYLIQRFKSADEYTRAEEARSESKDATQVPRSESEEATPGSDEGPDNTPPSMFDFMDAPNGLKQQGGASQT
ncbi:MAG: hypothetical protein R6U20_10510 [Longimonas sp.]|uniref:hypothetical protein n=1 Tax=Longimonas sp. TaxID=2039626 RepID=UPI003975A26B